MAKDTWKKIKTDVFLSSFYLVVFGLMLFFRNKAEEFVSKLDMVLKYALASLYILVFFTLLILLIIALTRVARKLWH